MPQGHHHHENKRDIRNTRLMQKAIRERERGISVLDKPIPLIDIGTDRINELIRSITDGNEDAFQDVWVSILEGNCQTEEGILTKAQEARKHTYVHNFPDISLQKPLTHESGKPLTIEDVIASPELVFDEPEPSHKPHKVDGEYTATYLKKQGLDADIVRLLQNKYPGESLKQALRMALDLPIKDTWHWKVGEIALLQRDYTRIGTDAVALELGRTPNAVRIKACELKLKRPSRRRTPQGCFNNEEVCNIFHFSMRHLRHIVANGYLTWKYYKSARVFHHDFIATFIHQHPFKYRHDLLEVGWQHFVPQWVWEWLTMEQVAKQVHWSHFTIRRIVRDGEIPIKYYGNGSKAMAYIQIGGIQTVLNADIEPQPYKVANFGELRHYVYFDEDNDLVRACQPNGRTFPYEFAVKIGYKPFVRGYPTCLKCQKILKKYRATKSK